MKADRGQLVDPALKYPVHRAIRSLSDRPIPAPLQLGKNTTSGGLAKAPRSADSIGTFGR